MNGNQYSGPISYNNLPIFVFGDFKRMAMASPPVTMSDLQGGEGRGGEGIYIYM
jgi:hypothetical protein